jgi:hypothetical protein
MRFDDGDSRYSRYARRARPQQKRLVIYAVLLVAVIAAMFMLNRRGNRPPAAIEWLPSFDEAEARALAQDKPLLAFFYAGDDEACQRMARDTFGDPAVRARAVDFVCVRLDGNAHPELAKRCLLSVLDYPAVAFLTPAGERLLVFWGGRDPKRMLHEMDTAMQEWQRGRLTESPSLPPRSAGPSRGDAESEESAEPPAADGAGEAAGP